MVKYISKANLCTYLNESIIIYKGSNTWLVDIIRLRGRASLVAQWLRICLLMQETRVWALVWEDPTCRRATRPVSHNYQACASGACAPQQERPRQWEARAPRWKSGPRLLQLEEALAQKRRPNTAKKINK